MGSIRFRISLLATLASAIVLIVAATALVALQRQQLFANLDNSLSQRADSYESSLVSLDSIPLALSPNDEDRAAQLVDANNRVLASSPNLKGAPSLHTGPAFGERQTSNNMRIIQLEDDSYRVLSRWIEIDSSPVILHVAQNIDDLNDAIRGLTFSLAFAVPTVVGLLGRLVWWLVGRTLQPVELIRSEVASISGADLHRRVPVPPQADEIGRLAKTMNEMLDRVDEASQRQRQFVSDASHELRTPLTRIRTEIEVDLAHPDQANLEATHRRVLEDALGLQRMLEDLLFLARSDEDQIILRREPTDLDDIVLREVQAARGHTTKDLDISQVSGGHLYADADQMGRMVTNLLSNALRHARTKVSIALVEDEDHIVLSVADDGPGVPETSRAQIFERFWRVDDSRARTDGGVGLGLAIVHDIVKRHQGSIRYDDEFISGARFVVRLPVNADPPRSSTLEAQSHEELLPRPVP